jgi:DNA-binding transcriptional ArsR family regulator
VSHAATNWAIEQRGLKPAAKIVLWHLCDCHNPRMGCFPGQEYLASVCEMSRSSVNNHLNTLEKAGLIKRIINIDPETKKQLPTEYKFPFQPEFGDLLAGQKIEGNPWSRVRNLDTEAVSKNEAEPCPNSGQSRVQNLDTNPVREPVKEPSAPTGGGAPDGPPPAGTGGAGGEIGAEGDGDDPGDGSQGSGAGEEAKAAIPKPLRHRTRDLIIRWLVRGDIDRFKAKALKHGLMDGGAPTGGIPALADIHPPNHDFEGPKAEQFIAAMPLTARKAVAGQVDWVLRWIAGADDNKPFEALAPLENSFRDNPLDGEGAKETRRNDRLAFLRESVERDMAASDGDMDDQSPDREGDHHTDGREGDHQSTEDAA